MYYVNKTLREKNVQDRVERSRLKVQLSLIEKQKKSELRMLESEAHKIRSRFSKTGVYPASFSEAAGVKMYETHNPGFCYRRNGTHKIPPSIPSILALDFQQLKSLIFTDDELDIEKLLCLHMLSVHKTETLTMPYQKQMKDISKENTPMERLIQRSRKINRQKRNDHDILNSLPIYVVDIIMDQSCTTLDSKEETEDQLFRDARISSKLIVNSKIQEILASALTALKKSKSEKLKQIEETCQNTVFLKKIFNRSSMQEFLKLLKTYSLITSCESYFLTPKIIQEPIHLEVRTIFGNLESLVEQIRKCILQLPSKSKNEWRSIYELNEELPDQTSSINFNLAQDHAVSKTIYVKKSSKSIASSIQMGNSENVKKSSSYLGGRSHRNFVNRNLPIVEDESATENIFVVGSRSRKGSKTGISEKIPYMFSKFNPFPIQMIASGHQTNLEAIENSQCATSSTNELDEEECEKYGMTDTASFIKRTNCCACQEKWKRSLPSPKIPNYKRPGLPLHIYEDPYKICHMNRISSMICEERYRLNSYDTKYSMDKVNPRIKSPQTSAPPTAPENVIYSVAESVEISPYDLARVSHEIADKETDKKLDAFLKSTI
ncbi:uncharacterized protein LOC123319502 [Coccinella septempunctata]|uniref:uncharacterized protein LOC123319502 n=1 Tax=Coccinella septempunctata TaxID=41139 RepID=UPI001D08D994|nr:uncharacterized protein LOC123319502 [Coccinella septempunctata]